jgi:hypothetical protein
MVHALSGTVGGARGLETHVVGVRGTWQGISFVANLLSGTAVAIIIIIIIIC